MQAVRAPGLPPGGRREGALHCQRLTIPSHLTLNPKGGLDYHIPVAGGRGTAPTLKVVHIAVEMAPIAKVGGMGWRAGRRAERSVGAWHCPASAVPHAPHAPRCLHTPPPSAQVGGMGDVVTALGRAVQEEGHDVEVVVPKYDVINYDQVGEVTIE
jgi:starch synthase